MILQIWASRCALDIWTNWYDATGRKWQTVCLKFWTTFEYRNRITIVCLTNTHNDHNSIILSCSVFCADCSQIQNPTQMQKQNWEDILSGGWSNNRSCSDEPKKAMQLTTGQSITMRKTKLAMNWFILANKNNQNDLIWCYTMVNEDMDLKFYFTCCIHKSSSD